MENFVCRLEKNINRIKELFANDGVIRFRRFTFCENIEGCLVYFDGMVNAELINESIMRPLVFARSVPSQATPVDFVYKNLLCAGEVKQEEDLRSAVSSILYGDTLLLIEGSFKALVINTKGWRTRGISEPENERVLEGPREGFDEAAMFSVAMIRRRLKTPDFCAELTKVGRRTDTFIFSMRFLSSLRTALFTRDLR